MTKIRFDEIDLLMKKLMIFSVKSPSDKESLLFFSLAGFTVLSFSIGMSLWGTHSKAGYFYVASLAFGAPLLLMMRLWRENIPYYVKLYTIFYFGFFSLCAFHFGFRDTPSGVLEYSGRFIFGIFNGFFFFHLFERDKRSLFRFLVLVASAHWIVSIGYTLHVGFDFENMSRIGPRVGGNTNPIPYSLLYITSAGIVTLALADQVRPNKKYLSLVAMVVVLAATALAATISGSRGTLMAMPLIVVLVAPLLWLRLGKAWSLGVFAVFIGVLLTAAATVFARDPNLWHTSWTYLVGDPSQLNLNSAASIRYDLWRAAMNLIPEKPLFGFGLSSMPEVLLHPAAGVHPDSVLFRFGHIHNEYLDILLKAGLVGFVLFYAPMAVALWLAFKRMADPVQRIWALAVMWVVGAQLIYGMTSVMFAHASTILQFGVYLGILMFVVAPDAKEAAPLADKG